MKSPLIATLAVACSLAVTPALAGYTIMDSDGVTPAAYAGPITQSPAIQATLHFIKGSARLESSVVSNMADNFGLLSGQRVTIIGRPDAKPNLTLARSRAKAVRDWLVDQGVPAINITMTTDNSPNPSESGYYYPISLRIGNLAAFTRSAPTPTQAPIATAMPAPKWDRLFPGTQPLQPASDTVRYSPAVRLVTPPSAPSPRQMPASLGVGNPEAVRSILNMLNNKRIDAETAVELIQELGGSKIPTLSEVAPAKEPEFSFVAAANTVKPAEWQLSESQTLKDNIEKWAKSQGLSLDWRAANFYRVVKAKTLEGDLIDTVDLVSKAAGLKMEYFKGDKLIRISDKA